jgi:hypothetical protein
MAPGEALPYDLLALRHYPGDNVRRIHSQTETELGHEGKSLSWRSIMRYRVIALPALCLLATAMSVLQVTADEDDPVIKGKKVSEWIAALKSKQAQAAIGALGEGGPKAKAAVPALLEVAKGGGYLGYQVRSALEKIGPAAVPALVKATKDENKLLSEMAIRLLRERYPDDAEKAGLGSRKEELAEMKKLVATKELKDTGWYCVGASTAKNFITRYSVGDGSRVIEMRFTTDKFVWTISELFFTKPGEGKWTANTMAQPAEIEITMGGKTYKGYYVVEKQKDSPVTMRMLLNEAGADFPKDFEPKRLSVPKGSKCTLLELVRAK